MLHACLCCLGKLWAALVRGSCRALADPVHSCCGLLATLSIQAWCGRLAAPSCRWCGGCGSRRLLCALLGGGCSGLLGSQQGYDWGTRCCTWLGSQQC